MREQLDVCLTASQGQPTTSTVIDPQAPGESLLQCLNTSSLSISSDFDVYRVGSLTLSLSLHCQCSVLPFLKRVHRDATSLEDWQSCWKHLCPAWGGTGLSSLRPAVFSLLTPAMDVLYALSVVMLFVD